MARRRRWTEADDAVMRERYPDMRTDQLAKILGRATTAVYGRAGKLGLRKSEAYLASPDACRLRRGEHVGRKTQFPKGHQPWNTGLKGYQPGGRAPETQFKAGHRPASWQPVGTEVLDPNGYLKRKVRDDAPKGMSRFNWRYVHVMLWEEHHGPLPKGHRVAFKNGDKADIRIDNLELVTPAQVMARNTIHNYPPEIVEAVQLRAAINRHINQRARDA